MLIYVIEFPKKVNEKRKKSIKYCTSIKDDDNVESQTAGHDAGAALCDTDFKDGGVKSYTADTATTNTDMLESVVKLLTTLVLQQPTQIC